MREIFMVFTGVGWGVSFPMGRSSLRSDTLGSFSMSREHAISAVDIIPAYRVVALLG